ncbi:Gp15 family bacteriophage protein [Oenococcus sicerae]|uniref:Gp15 family bacteriophage protein n=1 Tax=Oenococcus sicerae TaxID=2203724 RepID=UPI0039E8B970
MLDIIRPRELDEADNTFKWRGEDYLIDLSYDNVLRWFKLLDDGHVDQTRKVTLAFEMFIGSDLNVPIKAQAKEVNSIANLIAESPYGSSNDDNPIRVFDYQQDSEAIYASFLMDYNIDLIEQKGKLSYFKFRALLSNLSDKTPIKRIMNIRSDNAANYHDNPKYQQALMQQQAVFELKKTPEEREKELQAQMDKAF